ncbi:MAG: UvrD-helicase domain-containing protein [Synechococcaceae cyanobacterium]|nr:UvrD-helicase domain-containing protein [Synechococcaceae cyanobacterium]
MQPFEANALPLEPGLRLLEASAGTGKTFALAHLVLRLVGEAGRPLSRLLVVTFTDAATAELRDRIGQRLQEALACLEDPTRGPSDAVLAAWLEGRRGASGGGPGTAEPLLRGRLLLALEELDAADITTIHGFCRRTLQRQALEAGRSPDLQLDPDGETRLEQVVHEYAQQQLLPLPVALLAGLRSAGVAAQALVAVLRQLDGDPALQLAPSPDLPAWEEPLPRWLPALWQARWRRFCALWMQEGRSLENDLREAAQRWKEECGATRTGDYSARPRRDRCAELQAWIEAQPPGGDYGAVRSQPLLTRHYHPGGFSDEARRHEQPGDGQVRLPRPALMAAIAELVDGPAELALLHAAHHGRRELRERRERSGVTTFSQLLADLDPGPGGGAAAPLLQAVGDRYDAALVDEFQDTDPIQWRILRQAFGGGRHPLLIVGDPKQAIYRFRGGDLATYLRARAEADSLYELQENRRSTAALIGGLNALMAPGLPGSGLPVPPVRACAARAEPEPPQTPIEILWLGEPDAATPSKTALEAWLPRRLAAAVVELLGRGLQLGEGPGQRPLRADDICLLVSQHRQAEALRGALEQRGVPSRLVSRADVFASPAATALQRLLDALADPADPNRLRLLAASPLLGWEAARLAGDPERCSGRLAGRLADLAAQLPQRGLLGVLATLLDGERMASLVLSGRLLADLQQVAGLVQERMHADQLGAEAAADWLRRLRLNRERTVPEEHQAHSDRVDGAVSVVTIHRSKGLEYPVVICPVLWSGAASQRGGPPRPGSRWQPPGAAAPRLDLHLDGRWGEGWAARRQQRLAEQAERERLAYVAATRARDLLLLAWGPARGQQGGPLFPWLFPEEGLPDPDQDTVAETPPQTWRERLEEQIRRRALPIALREPPPAEGPRWVPPAATAAHPLACGPVPLPQALDRLWGRSSYSSWTAAAHSEPGGIASQPDEGRDTFDPEGELEAAPVPSAAAPEPTVPEADSPLAAFPRGAAAGDCLHRILERIELTEPLTTPANEEVVERELRRAGLASSWQETTVEGLERMRASPFGGHLGALRPADLVPNGRRAELGFDLRIDTVRSEDLARPFREHPGGAFGADYAERLAGLPIASRGFLTGSIDLVFQTPAGAEDGRWWVVDWKSNWLGERDATGRPVRCGPRHYGREALTLLMLERHYPLQAHLYLVALHRLLAWRLPGYEPERHLGGYAYVFLRGTPGPLEEGGAAAAGQGEPAWVPGMLVDTPPLTRLLALDEVLGGRGEAPW